MRSVRLVYNVEVGDRPSPYIVPDLRGLTLVQAREVAKTYAAKIRVSGNGAYVVRQTPKARSRGVQAKTIAVQLGG